MNIVVLNTGQTLSLDQYILSYSQNTIYVKKQTKKKGKEMTPNKSTYSVILGANFDVLCECNTFLIAPSSVSNFFG